MSEKDFSNDVGMQGPKDYRFDARPDVRPAAPPPPYPPYGTYPAGRVKNPNVVLLFICSLTLPGVGYMYLGLMKRGLFFLTAFFVSVFAAASLGSGFFAFAIPILYITAFFDGFKKRREMIMGYKVEDSISEIVGFASKYRVGLTLFGLIMLVLLFLGKAMRLVSFGIWSGHFQALTGIIILGLIIYAVYRFFFKKKSTGYIDKREDN